MSPSPEAAAHTEARRRLAVATALATHKMWRQVDEHDMYRSWTGLLANTLSLVVAGQLAAARMSNPWLARLVGPGDEERPAADQVVPEAFTGVDGAGRPLLGGLVAPIWTALRLAAQGRPAAHALLAGRAVLDAIVQTAVADIGRAADQSAMVSHPTVTTYVRVTESGACARCIILAGIRVGGVSTAFQRHPRCHCAMEPVTEDHHVEPFDAKDVYDQMSPEQRKKTFGEAGMKAIDGGADIAQVVNARRGMQSATVYGRKLQITTEGRSTRGFAGRRLQNFAKEPGRRYRVSRTPRLMPEEIFRQADNRADAVRLLRLHGYIA